ncbi:MAG: DUF4007 family protein [Anaerostipes sp.]|nr:DUF4007 family protein [Anaerostipes sp.]MDD3746279.1 DUF4007 family protein [Anaerostipes sp.]
MENGKVKIRLQGHEKFPLREGWLNKGLTEVANNPTVFVGKEGADILGLGNNMVKSLRYWLKAFGLIVENGAQGANLTRCGELILQYDAYFEDLFSLWILHSNIVKNAEEATTWFLFFNKCDIEELDKEQIIHILKRELDKYTNNGKYSEKSMMNDVDVLLNMYGKTRGIIDPEDKSSSPFSILDLIKNSDGLYSRITPDRRMLNEWNILYELAIKMQGKEFISIDELSEGIAGIATIYQINSVQINEYLDKLDAMGFIQVNRTAGLDMVYKVRELSQESVMIQYYETHR